MKNTGLCRGPDHSSAVERVEPLELLIERRPRDAEVARGLGAVAAGEGEGGTDRGGFEVAQCVGVSVGVEEGEGLRALGGEVGAEVVGGADDPSRLDG